MIESVLNNEKDMTAVGIDLASALQPGCYITLKGDLGSGKTCLCRGILRGLGFLGRVKSPTYPILETYKLETGTVFHFDFYRISNPKEIFDAGFEEFFGHSDICLVEWPERTEGALRVPDISIEIDFHGDGRLVKINALTKLGKHCLEEIS